MSYYLFRLIINSEELQDKNTVFMVFNKEKKDSSRTLDRMVQMIGTIPTFEASILSCGYFRISKN